LIDLHCHVLPGIDDGPSDAEDSLEFARGLVADGVSVAAATPHLRDDHPGVVPGELAERCAELNARLADQEIPLEVVPAGEWDLVRGLEASDEDLRLASYGQRGSDLLLETPYGPLPPTFESLVFELQMKGYRVLLAHPERNPTLREDLHRLADLIRRGALVQVTAQSLVMPPSKSRSARAARAIVQDGLCHVIASDGHGSSFVRDPLSAGVEAARELIGERADWMAAEAPAAILEGRPLPEGPPVRQRKRGLIDRLRS
jgi:protein-tyrosine phosphatase